MKNLFFKRFINWKLNYIHPNLCCIMTAFLPTFLLFSTKCYNFNKPKITMKLHVGKKTIFNIQTYYTDYIVLTQVV